MPLFKREDGVNFILQPYRESITIRNTSLLRKEIYYLAEQYGKYVRLFKRKGGEYEAVFYQEPGLLLGETVWNHFHKPEEFIYCEKLEDAADSDILLVIVREGKVYLDTKISFDVLKDELNALFVENTERYSVYFYGENIQALFGHPAVKSLNALESSLFAGLAVNSAFQLLSLEQALDEQGLLPRHRSSLLLVTIICVGILGGLWWYAHSRETKTVYMNPYVQYERILEAPGPADQMHALLEGLQKTENLSGWYFSAFTYENNTAKLVLHSLGGTASGLMTQAEGQGLNLNFSSEGAIVNFTTAANPRPVPTKIARIQETIALIIDRMMQLLPGKSVQINNATQNSVFTETRVTISFNNISPEILQLIASRLNDLPVVMISVTANKNGGLFSGNLQLNVVGN